MSRLWGARAPVLGLLACATCLMGCAGSASAANVSFRLTGGGRSIPKQFLGLSMEYNSVATYQGMGGVFKQAVSLFRAENGAPMVLRVGGKSADHVYWDPQGKTNPPKNTWRIGTPWMSNLVHMVKGNNMRAMLDLNLAVHSPTMESAFTVAARKALPGRLMGVEIGNEPDLYKNQPWLSKERIATTTGVHGKWPLSYSYPQYHRDWLVYARALRKAVHGISLGGPETISSKLQYIQAVQHDGSLNANFITIHRYPSSSCWPKGSRWYPTIRMMLAAGASSGLAHTVANTVSLAHSHRQALRLTEVNSISCGGNNGVANSFATALWAPDALLNLVKVGVDSINWHIQPDLPNSPFHWSSRKGLHALPEMYGLSLFGQMMKPGAVLLNSSTSNSSDPSVSVWAVRFNGGMRVLVINKSAQPSWTTLNVGHHQSAFVRTLRAPGVGSTNGETYGGQHISVTGHWKGRVRSPSVPYSGGAYHVYVGKYSAAMLTLWR